MATYRKDNKSLLSSVFTRSLALKLLGKINRKYPLIYDYIVGGNSNIYSSYISLLHFIDTFELHNPIFKYMNLEDELEKYDDYNITPNIFYMALYDIIKREHHTIEKYLLTFNQL